MTSTLDASPDYLDQAAQALRQVLLRLDQYAKSQVQRLDLSRPYAAATMTHVRDLDALMSAMQDYEQAVTDCLPPVPIWAANPHPTPAELRAEREAEPLYRLGYVRGYRRALEQQGQHQGAQQIQQTLPAAARQQLPLRYLSEEQIQGIRAFLTDLTQRYGGKSPHHHQSPTHRHGTL